MAMNKSILCIDIGTVTGWAFKNRSNLATSGTKSFKGSRFEGGGMKYLRFNIWLNKILDEVGIIDLVYFEAVNRHLGVAAAHAYGGYLSQLTAWCEKHKIPYMGVGVGTIKKFIAGKGNANKEDVIKRIKSLGHDPKDDNEADALALMYYAKKENHFN